MALEEKVKRAALNTALRRQLKNLSVSKERTCRNLIDFGMLLRPRAFTKAEAGRLQEELLCLLDHPDPERIRQWMTEHFLT